MMQLQFDGDYNVILPTLTQHLRQNAGIDLPEELNGVVPDEISTGFLDGFIYTDDDEKQTLYPQIYSPDYEYIKDGDPAAHLSPVVVPATYFDDAQNDEVYTGYFYNDLGELDSIQVGEDDLEKRSVWVISINESELDADGNPSVDGAKGKITRPKDDFYCPDKKFKKIEVVGDVEIGEIKERWISGRVEVWYSIMEYQDGSDAGSNQGKVSSKHYAQLIPKISRKDIIKQITTNGEVRTKPVIGTGKYLSVHVPDKNRVLFEDWEVACNPNNCFLIIYEKDIFFKKQIVPDGCTVIDFKEDQSTIPNSPAYSGAITHKESKDNDTRNNITQQELPYKTTNRINEFYDVNRDLPFGVLKIYQWMAIGINNYISDSWGVLQPFYPNPLQVRYSYYYTINPTPVFDPDGNDRKYLISGSGIKFTYNISYR
jgi:hypothetical protein